MLEGLRVIDLGSFVAGPAAATILGDLGADVIKIEPPDGDAYRRLIGAAPVDFFWLLDGRNKRSLAVDLLTEKGRGILFELVDRADVLVTNYRPSLLERLRVRPAELLARNPRLIIGQVTGYGLVGDEANRGAFDTTAYWARSGLMDYVRGRGLPPVLSAPGMGDHPTATALFGAVMTALYRRERTGRGGLVSTSLVANGLWAHGMVVQSAFGGADFGGLRQSGDAPLAPLAHPYRTADDRWLLLTVLNPDKEWRGLSRALGRPEWQQDQRFAQAAERVAHAGDLLNEIGAAVHELALAELRLRLDAENITYGWAADAMELATDPQLRAIGAVRETGSADPAYQLTVDSPLQLDGVAKRLSRAPAIGEHSRAILAELGYDAVHIDALTAAGVITSPA